jgi:mannose-6-phosphate isomerase-like protein (cupin superfamily)
MKMKVLVLLLLLSVCSSLALAWQTDTGSGSGSGSGRPYHYGEESFRHWTRSRQGRFRVLERFTHELLEDAVGNYRVAELEAAPRAFLQPSHYDGDEVMFVKEGEGVVVLLRGGRRESFCVREGDVMDSWSSPPAPSCTPPTRTTRSGSASSCFSAPSPRLDASRFASLASLLVLLICGMQRELTKLLFVL